MPLIDIIQDIDAGGPGSGRHPGDIHNTFLQHGFHQTGPHSYHHDKTNSTGQYNPEDRFGNRSWSVQNNKTGATTRGANADPLDQHLGKHVSAGGPGSGPQGGKHAIPEGMHEQYHNKMMGLKLKFNPDTGLYHPPRTWSIPPRTPEEIKSDPSYKPVAPPKPKADTAPTSMQDRMVIDYFKDLKKKGYKV